MRPKLVIFDCDGVLVDSEIITNAMLRDELASYGLPLKPSEIVEMFVGGTIRGVAERAREMGAGLPESWVEDFYTRMYARLALGTPLIPGVIDVLDRLDAASIPYRVCSNGSGQKMQTTLGQHPALWPRLKDKLFSAHRHGIAKPDPGLMLLAAADAGVTPADCVVVDDSPTGCIAGLRAGMRVLGFAEHSDGARLRAVGAEVFHAMKDLPGLLTLS